MNYLKKFYKLNKAMTKAEKKEKIKELNILRDENFS
jgi:hypothetical protein